MAPENIVLLKEYAEFIFPQIVLGNTSGTMNNLFTGDPITLTPEGDTALDLPEITPGKFGLLSFNPNQYFFVGNAAGPTGEAIIPAYPITNNYNYTIDGIANRSSISEKITIKKGSVRKVIFTSIISEMMCNIFNLATTAVFTLDPGASVICRYKLAPVIRIIY